MKRYTMLEMVQEVARAIGADEITTLDESVEATDIAHVVVQALESISTRREWYWRQHQTRLAVPPLSGLLRVVLDLPADCDTIERVSYRKDVAGSTKVTFVELTYLSPDKFLELTGSRDLTDSNVDTIPMLPDARPIYVYNNVAPRYYTQFQEGQIVCDSYDKAVDITGLQAGKTMILCTVNVDTSTSNQASWVPNIPTRFFPLWLAESVALAHTTLRQMSNERAERESRRLLIDLTEFNEQVKSEREPKGG